MPKLRLADEELKNILNDYNAEISMADVGAKYHHNPGTLKRYFIEHNIPVRTREEGLRASLKKQESDKLKRIYWINENFFSEQNSEMAYVLGFLMADGNVGKKNNLIQISLAAIDKELLESIHQLVGGSPLYEYVQNNHSYVRWYCTSSKIKRDLAEYDVIPQKTGFAKIPSKLDKKFYPDFIRGYFDGDGCVYKDNAIGLNFTSHNKEILQNILDNLEELGVAPVMIHEYSHRPGNYYIRYRTRATLKIYDIFYKDENCLKLQRKFEKFTALIQKRKNSTRLRT